MADSLKISFDAARLTAALREYAQVSGKDAAVVVESQAKKLSVDLFNAYKPHTPTKQRIYDEAKAVFARGGRLRIKGGAQATFSHHAGPRSASSARFNVPAGAMAAEINRRQSKRGAVAASWLIKRWRPSARGPRRLVVNRPGTPSRARIATAGESPFVILENAAAGVIAGDSRHGLIGRALAQRAGDMLLYIRRKHLQRAAQFSRKTPLFSA